VAFKFLNVLVLNIAEILLKVALNTIRQAKQTNNQTCFPFYLHSRAIGTDSICSCKSNYHLITAKTAPESKFDETKNNFLYSNHAPDIIALCETFFREIF
jgi:hypothetical protein